MEVTIQLPEKLYEQAQQWAAITQQDLDDVLTDALAVILTPVYTSPEFEKPISTLSDHELLEQTSLRMPETQGRRFSKLLNMQQEDALTPETRRELFALAQLYQRLWLRQSQALAEAAERGLKPPMHS